MRQKNKRARKKRTPLLYVLKKAPCGVLFKVKGKSEKLKGSEDFCVKRKNQPSFLVSRFSFLVFLDICFIL
jgi:hypothetical protein